MYQDGDFLIGGLFEVQYLKTFPELSFTMEPKLPRCELFYMTSFQQARTMVFAISEINNNPSLLPNITLGYQIFDNCLRLGVAFRGAIALASGTKETVSDLNCKGPPPVIGLIGDPGSTHSIAISSVLGLFRVPMISFYATCSCLSNRKKYPSFFRTIPSDAFQVRAMVQILRHFRWTWVGLIYSNNDYGVYAAQSFHQEMQLFGHCVAFSEILPNNNNPRDIQRIMGVIQASTARVVVVFSHSSLLIPLMNEVVLQNMTGRQWIASEAWATSPMFHTSRFHPFLGGTLGIAIRRGEIQGLQDFLLRLHPNTDQRNNMLRIFWENIFGCSFETESKETDGEQVKRVCTGLEDLNTTHTPYTDVSGLRASYNVYKAVYALAYALHDLIQCEKGRGPFSGNSCADMSNLNPWQLVHYLQKVNFTTGFGDHVSFDKNGDAVAIYDVLNWQPNSDGAIRFHKVGVVSEEPATGMILMLDEDAVYWNFENKKVMNPGLDFLSATGAILEVAQGRCGLRSGKGYTYYTFLPTQVPANLVTPSAQAHSLTAVKVNLYYALPPTSRFPELMSFTPEIPKWDSDNQDELLKLISAWPHSTSNTLGKTSVVQHKITLTNDIPLKSRAYRVSPIKKQIVEQHVDQMLQDSTIESSFPPWSSPVVLVPKPNGSYWFCVDYKKLNSKTVPDAYPMPDS
ncbi:extracellular calcium-sensing receptor-like protein [Labeo rohita]|uniref:Extracellular calcium-sensing receptor-like protein n=1 Tax=Labeo rohita TaxID=84645 RepID=A0A498LWZ3_LABRO|nr:extracellular calcium-sensing receptor-like protein [Labeo rohita]RXN28354.1 extracellular calcium-sensing receptor-like protein [Labeo rohita]